MTASVSRLLRLFSIVALLLAFVGLVAPYLNRTMQYDEAYTVRFYAFSPSAALFSYTLPNNHMLHSFCVWVVSQVLGTSRMALRFTAFIFALLSLAMTFRLGKRMIGFHGGLIAAVLLATNLAFADYAVNARGYTLSIFLALGLVEEVFLADRRNRILPVIFLTSAALVITLPSMIVLIAGVGLYMVWKFAWTRCLAYIPLVLALIIGTIAGAIFYIPSLTSGVLGGQFSRFGLDTPLELSTEWLNLTFTTPNVGVVTAFACLVGLAWVFISVRRRRLREVLIFIFIVAMLLALAQWKVTGKLFFARNYLYLTPLIYLAGAATVVVLPARVGRNGGAAVLAFLLLIAVVVPFQRLGAPTEIDAVLSRISEHMVAGDVIIMGCCVEVPVTFELTHTGRAALLTPTAATRRLFVLATEFNSLEDLLWRLRMQKYASNCQRADSWQPFEVYECAYGIAPQTPATG